MKNNNNIQTQPIPPELKHDSMEYAASTEGDDQLDVPEEDEEVTADELADLEEENADDDAYALNAAETDSEEDEDNFLTMPDDVDELEEDNPDDEDIEPRR